MFYRLNKYIVSGKKDNGDLILFNTMNFKMVSIREDDWLKIIQMLSSNTFDVGLDSNEVLLQKEIIVSEETKEEDVVEYRYWQTCHSNDVLDLLIMPTLDCNFRCKYCYEDHEHISMGEEEQSNIVAFVKKNIKKYGSLHVSWFGGEPLLRVDIVENLSTAFLEICRENKKVYMAEMTTNGYLLTYEMFQLLKKYKIFFYQITLDGIKEFHDKQRFLADGTGSFEKITNNLKDIIQKDHSRLCSFLIRTNLTKDNAEYDQYMDEYFEKNFGMDSRFKRMVTFAWPGKNANKSMYLSDDEALNHYTGNAINLLEGIENDTEEIAKFKVEQLRRMMIPCKCARSNHFGIRPDGRVFACEAHYDEKNVTIGNLDKEGFLIVDENVHSKWVARTEKTSCINCTVYPVCMSASCPYKISILHCDKACTDIRLAIYKIMNKLSKNEYICREIR